MKTELIMKQIKSFQNSDRADKEEMVAYWKAKMPDNFVKNGKYNSPKLSTRDRCIICEDYGVWTNRYGKCEDCE